jgi:thiamine biosynthesis lipoprotein
LQWGSYERGNHIVDPRDGSKPEALQSFTVVGPSIELADAHATCGFVMGLDGIGWVETHPDFCAFAITAEYRTVFSDRFAKLMAKASSAN